MGRYQYIPSHGRVLAPVSCDQCCRHWSGRSHECRRLVARAVAGLVVVALVAL